jgi:hypothetical protein
MYFYFFAVISHWTRAIPFVSPPPKDGLCQLWLKLVQWFWRSRKCKSLQTDRQTDGRRAIRKAHLSFQLRWAKKSGDQFSTIYLVKVHYPAEIANSQKKFVTISGQYLYLEWEKKLWKTLNGQLAPVSHGQTVPCVTIT